MRIIFQVLLILPFAATIIYAADPLELDHGEQPNHLVPVTPRSDTYIKLVEEKLLVTPADYGRMIFRPSFSGEFAVSVYGDNYTESYPREPLVFHITLTKAKDSIWYSMPENNGQKKQESTAIIRIDIIIDKTLAVAIQRAWATMLLKTRYPLKAYAGCDGYEAEFSVFVRCIGDLYGEIWSPDRGLPKEMVELGLALKDFCETPSDQRPAKQQKIMSQLASFTRKAQ